MTVSTTNTNDPYVSDGATTVYPFTFQIISDSFGNPDPTTVAVLFNDVQQTSGILVTPNDDQESSPGGSVTLLNGAQPAGTEILVERQTPATQDTSFPLSAKLSTPALETALDKIIMVAQEAGADALAAITLEAPIPGVSTILPAPVAGSIPVWNAGATAMDYVEPVQAHYVMTDNGPDLPPTMQPLPSEAGSGGVYGPATSTPYSLAMWNNDTGTSLSDGPELGTAGQLMTSNGLDAAPSMQAPPLIGPGVTVNNSLALWNGTAGNELAAGPAMPAATGLPLISQGATGAPIFSTPPPNPYYLAPARHRRVMWWQEITDAATNLVAVGAAALTVTGTITHNLVSLVGKFLNAATAAGVNDSAGWISPSLDETVLGLGWSAAVHAYTGASIAACRIWIGLFSSTPVATDTVVDGAGFRYSTAAGDTHWQAVAGTGSARTVVDTGVVVAAATEYRFFIDASQAGNIYFWINETLVATISTNLPSATQDTGPCALITTLAVAAKSLGIAKFSLESL